jgi:hypothetical protein
VQQALVVPVLPVAVGPGRSRVVPVARGRCETGGLASVRTAHQGQRKYYLPGKLPAEAKEDMQCFHRKLVF